MDARPTLSLSPLILPLALAMAVGCEPDSESEVHTAWTRMQTTAAIYGLPASDPPPMPSAACADGTVVCATPETLEGRIYSGGLSVGYGLPDGVPGVMLTTIGATQRVRDRPDLGKGGEIFFDIAQATDISGSYSCCGGPIPYPADEHANIGSLDFNFDYLDMTFTVPDEAGEQVRGRRFTLRQVYVTDAVSDDVAGTMRLADKLIRDADDPSATFEWCTATECGYTTRPESPVQARNIALPVGHHGNPAYATFIVQLPEADWVQFTEENALTGNWMFHVAFDLTDGAVFRMPSWASIDSKARLVESFELRTNDQANPGVRVRLEKEYLGERDTPPPSGGHDGGPDDDGPDDGPGG